MNSNRARTSPSLNGIALIALFLAGCEREIPVESNDDSTEGYEIVGHVIDGLGNPVPGVGVKVYYDYQFVDNNEPPPMEFQVTNSVQIIKVNVYDSSDRVLRTLYNGAHALGIMQVEWNKKNLLGKDVPSGVYTVRYLINNEVRMSYPVTVDRTITTVTDSTGSYALTDTNLPVGFYPVPLYSVDNEEYFGQFRVTNFVALEFITEARTRSVIVSLSKGNVNRVDITL